jgi:hypothetical protein
MTEQNFEVEENVDFFIQNALEEYPNLAIYVKDVDPGDKDQIFAIFSAKLARIRTDWDKNFIANGDSFVWVSYLSPYTQKVEKVRVDKFVFLAMRNHIADEHRAEFGVYPASSYKLTARKFSELWEEKLKKVKATNPSKPFSFTELEIG